MIGRIWHWFWKPTSRYGWGGILIVGGVAGVLFWGAFNTFMEYTNTLEFCVSCHEMEQTVYAEYKESVHYRNAAGVRAVCSDCHVPKPWVPKLVRKVQASNELFHKVMGTIDTPEKFEAKRLELARHVWASMEASDSRECRNCHAYETMDFHKQRKKSREQMEKAMKEGDTCISCHKGIAHKMPDMSAGYKAMYADLMAAGPDNSDTLYTLTTSDLFLDRDAAKAEGKGPARVLGLTKLAVLERDGDWIKVRIDGWQQDGVDKLIYALMSQRIFSVALGGPAIQAVQRHESKVNPDTEQTWHRVSIDGWVAKAGLTGNEKGIWDYGAEMYTGACSVCHSKPAPDHYLANQWIGTLKSMQRFITMDKEEYRFLQKYLQFNAKDTAPGSAHGGGGHG
ncbi:MAG: NapC/NirT family cytochrome c [Rhodobacterales bacterium]|nr:NapC/NirT family cytochrome c [Rhodobacterales bacterium]